MSTPVSCPRCASRRVEQTSMRRWRCAACAKKWNVGKTVTRPFWELARLAFIYAEHDRASYADADPGMAGAEARALANELRAYRLKRWGKTSLEKQMEGATSKPITDILKEMGHGKT